MYKTTEREEIRRYSIPFLKSVLSVQSCSNNDTDMLEFLSKTLLDIQKTYDPDMMIQRDSYNNIYVTRGKRNDYPCIVSHVDTVHNIVTGYKVNKQNDLFYAFSDTLKKQVGIGGKSLPPYIEIYRKKLTKIEES